MGRSAMCAVPPMGWNSWNTFAENINEDLVKKTFSCLIQLGDGLGFTEAEMVDACKKKQEKVKLRLEDVHY